MGHDIMMMNLWTVNSNAQLWHLPEKTEYMLQEICSHQAEIKDSETISRERAGETSVERGYKPHAGNHNTSPFHQSILDLYFTG